MTLQDKIDKIQELEEAIRQKEAGGEWYVAESQLRAALINAAWPELLRRIGELERPSGVPCSGCGMVMPGAPSNEPWGCDKCLDDSSAEHMACAAYQERITELEAQNAELLSVAKNRKSDLEQFYPEGFFDAGETQIP